ncbi:MAG: maltose alpha-D-glucosyltransferase / alpha-amylase, partial [Pseudonocardiales bacterium]|nr:maltose alpha-D-glucosyltransferase / alpha-amylase [Pseudonocardiales bacterium]
MSIDLERSDGSSSLDRPAAAQALGAGPRAAVPAPNPQSSERSRGTHPAERAELTEPDSEDFRHARELPLEPDWFKRAVFYEVLVRAFYDSTRDGTGDLRGLTEKLDYLS